MTKFGYFVGVELRRFWFLPWLSFYHSPAKIGDFIFNEGVSGLSFEGGFLCFMFNFTLSWKE